MLETTTLTVYGQQDIQPPRCNIVAFGESPVSFSYLNFKIQRPLYEQKYCLFTKFVRILQLHLPEIVFQEENHSSCVQNTISLFDKICRTIAVCKESLLCCVKYFQILTCPISSFSYYENDIQLRPCGMKFLISR